jgi:hypothetical protein
VERIVVIMKFSLPAGTYYIGDPCYVFRDGNWSKVCDNLGKSDGIFDCLSMLFFMAGTEYGDGCYYDQDGHMFDVDAGVLGAVPVELVEDKDGLRLGLVKDFPSGLKIEYDGHRFDFGGIIIETDDSYYDEDDEEDWDDDEEDWDDDEEDWDDDGR